MKCFLCPITLNKTINRKSLTLRHVLRKKNVCWLVELRAYVKTMFNADFFSGIAFRQLQVHKLPGNNFWSASTMSCMPGSRTVPTVLRSWGRDGCTQE